MKHEITEKKSKQAIGIIELSRFSEDDARTFLEGIRWNGTPVCPHCNSNSVTRLHGTAHRLGTFQCNQCREQFTVTVGTVMQGSKIPIRTWLLAFFMICSSKKGISALQLKRQLNLKSYQTAWHLCHRIRYAMTKGPLSKRLQTLGGGGNIVEVDETYVGGKPRKLSSRKLEALTEQERISGKPLPRKRGRGTDKTPVVALVERNGSVHSQPVEYVDGNHLTALVKQHVIPKTTIVTDEFSSYNQLKKYFDHETVNHSINEFSRNKNNQSLHVNTAESYFSLLKRGYIGAFHKISKKHLHRYCAEFDFRWERRRMADDERLVEALKGIEGKRLSYYPVKGDDQSFQNNDQGSKERCLVEITEEKSENNQVN